LLLGPLAPKNEKTIFRTASRVFQITLSRKSQSHNLINVGWNKPFRLTMNSARYLSYLLFLLTPSSVFSSPLPGTDGDGNSNCNWDEDACHRYANSTTGSTWGGLMDDASYPSGCIRIRQPDPADDMVVLNSNIAGVESRDGVAPTCQCE
jgi:hypothetical protein